MEKTAKEKEKQDMIDQFNMMVAEISQKFLS